MTYAKNPKSPAIFALVLVRTAARAKQLAAKESEAWGLIEGRVLGKEDGTDEIVRADVRMIVAEFVGFGNAVGVAVELGTETSFDLIEENLFLFGERRVVLPRINELLGLM